jgi:hypothetical protein
LDTLGYYSGTSYDQAGWITNDLPCSQCNANLRGQHVGGRCPQCGRPVGLNLYGDLLQYSQPAWLRTIRGGMMTILWTALALIVALAVLIAVLLILMGSSTAAGSSTVTTTATTTTANGGMTTTATAVTWAAGPGWMSSVVAIVGLAGAAFFAFGTWRMTAPDPSGAGETQYGTLRKFLRVSLFVGLGVGLISVITTAVLGLDAADATAWPTSTPRLAFHIASTIFEVVVTVAQAHYLGHLAARVPDVGMTRRFRMVGWGIGICLTLGVAGQMVSLILLSGAAGPGSGVPNLNGPFIAITCANSLVGIGMLAFFILYLVAFVQLASRFRIAAAYAEAVWAQPFPAQASPGFVPPGQPAGGA